MPDQKNTLFVVGAAFLTPESVLKPHLDKIQEAVGSLGITAQLLPLTPRDKLPELTSDCPYSDPDVGNIWIDVARERIYRSRGLVIVNPDTDTHDKAEFRYAVGGFAAWLGSSRETTFLSHLRPVIAGNGRPDARVENWDRHIRSVRGAKALNQDYSKLADALK